MTSDKNVPRDDAQEHRHDTDPALCPECGAPVEKCDCSKRWENEGGAPYPKKE